MGYGGVRPGVVRFGWVRCGMEFLQKSINLIEKLVKSMEKNQKTDQKDQETVIHLHRQDGPQFKDSIEIGSPGKGGSIKVYFDASLPEDAEHRIRSTIRLKKLALSLYQEVQS